MEKNNLKLIQIIEKIESGLLDKGYRKNNKEITRDSPVLEVNNEGTDFKAQIEVPDTNDMVQTLNLYGHATKMNITLVLALFQPQELNNEQVDTTHHYASFFKRQGIDGHLTVDSDKRRVSITSNLIIAYNECDEILFERLIPAMIENMRSYHSLNQEWLKNKILLD